MRDHVFRVHPAIGFARVGNSEAFYIGPETMAGLPVAGESKLTGGLPIKPGTEAQPITSGDLRDKNGAFKRQAARFRIYAYPKTDEPETYPNGKGKEIKIGSEIGGKKVADIIWTVHVANKKANTFVLENPKLAPDEQIVDGYAQGNLPPLRNLAEGTDPNNASRVRKLTIDPGPRAVRGADAAPVPFNRDTPATYGKGDDIATILDYPKSFPEDSFSNLYTPTGNIDTLGELRTDDQGRLLVLGGYGKACAWDRADGQPYPLDAFVDNDGWFDDTSDGPVSASLVFEDQTVQKVFGAWVIATDPAYAPQTLNVVSLWDDIYDTWVRKLNLAPEIYKGGRFQDKDQPARGRKAYKPYFPDQIYPIFRAAGLQRWNTNLPDLAIRAHDAVNNIKAGDNPADTILAGLAFIRDPNDSGQNSVGAPLMPLSLGDQGKPFLSLSLTQYFFLQQWNKGKAHFHEGSGPKLGPGEYLDKAVLVNCLGGRFSPGIDMTFICRQPGLYRTHWNCSGSGPFRIHAKVLDYQSVQPSQPLLGEGWVPLHASAREGLEPGDASKFMAIPWHTDYNSCAVHTTAPNPLDTTTLYWSWPAQRPVAIYRAEDVSNGKLGPQEFSVRGKGTETDNPANEGRYREGLGMVLNWPRIGVVIQGNAIDGGPYNPDYYLEVESQLDEQPVVPWPINAREKVES